MFLMSFWIPVFTGMTEGVSMRTYYSIAGMTEYIRLLITDMVKYLTFFLDCFASLAMTEKMKLLHYFLSCMQSEILYFLGYHIPHNALAQCIISPQYALFYKNLMFGRGNNKESDDKNKIYSVNSGLLRHFIPRNDRERVITILFHLLHAK
jgi:hypothetical protein